MKVVVSHKSTINMVTYTNVSSITYNSELKQYTITNDIGSYTYSAGSYIIAILNA